MTRKTPLLAAMVAGALGTGCTSLGPMPATAGISAVPAGRPDVALQFGAVPGFRLSEATESSGGRPQFQGAAVVEPDRWIGVPGVIAGVRSVRGEGGDSYAEPMLGYRAHLDRGRHFSLLGVGSAAKAGHSDRGASYEATRGSGEVLLDVNPHSSAIVELHLMAGAGAMALSGTGTYCVRSDGRGTDCDTTTPSSQPTTPQPTARGSVGGMYMALNGGIALDVARGLNSWFHGGRLALLAAHGQMPTVVWGTEGPPRAYTTVGLTITLAAGAR